MSRFLTLFCLVMAMLLATGCCCRPYQTRAHNPYQDRTVDWYSWPKESMEPKTRRVAIPRVYKRYGISQSASIGVMPQLHNGVLLEYE